MNAWHQRKQRSDRRTCRDIDDPIRKLLPYVRNRRERHHRVAEPVRRQNEQPPHWRHPAAGCGTVRLSMSTGRIPPLPANALLSVVMPVYNERTTVEEIIRRVLAVPLRIELIVVDDGSKDGS